MILLTINNNCEQECLDEVVSLLNAHLRYQSTDACVPGCMYSIPILPRTKFLVHQVWAIWFNVRTWFGDCNMPGVLVADEMGIGITFTSVATAMICKLPTEKLVNGLPLSMLWGNTMEVWMNMAKNKLSRIICEAQECISNIPSFRQKHRGVSVDPVGSDGTEYPLAENFTLLFALHTYLLYFAPGMWLDICTIRMTGVIHSWQGLQISCNHLHSA